MVIRKRETIAPITLGHIRSHGCRELLVYCASGRCHHSSTVDANWLADEFPGVCRCSVRTDGLYALRYDRS